LPQGDRALRDRGGQWLDDGRRQGRESSPGHRAQSAGGERQVKYVSTRGHSAEQGFTDILLEGLGSDGGLMVPEQWPRVTRPKLDAMRALSYPALAFEVLRFFADDFPGAELKSLVEGTYTR